ncbi:MAG: thioesterase family protein [Gemmatimonadaceae bacterium]
MPSPSAGHETVSEVRVRYAETDQMGVVYHANYLIWCEIGRTDFIRTLGPSYAEMEAMGVRLAVSDATVRYHGSARYDDPIRIRTTLVSVRSRALRFAYRIEQAQSGALLVTASTDLVSLGADNRPAMLPPEIRAALASVVTAEPNGPRG